MEQNLSFQSIMNQSMSTCIIPQINGLDVTIIKPLPFNFRTVQSITIVPRVYPIEKMDVSHEELNPGKYQSSLDGTIFNVPLSLILNQQQLSFNIQPSFRNNIFTNFSSTISKRPDIQALIEYSTKFTNCSLMFSSFNWFTQNNLTLNVGKKMGNILFGLNSSYDIQQFSHKNFFPDATNILFNYTIPSSKRKNVIETFYSQKPTHKNVISLALHLSSSSPFSLSIENDIHIGTKTITGINLQVNPHSLQTELRLGFKRNFEPLSSFSASFESRGKVSSLLQKFIRPGIILLVSSFADLKRSIYVMGLGITVTEK